jgi:RecB family exonuclease
VEDMLATAPHGGTGETVTMAALCTGAIRFLERFCRVTNDFDAAGKGRLVELLTSLTRAPTLSEPVKEMAERVAGLVMELAIGHSGPKPGHVHVTPYRSGGYTGRSHTFVLGFDQGRFPGPMLQDPVILDQERRRLSPRMALAQDVHEESLYSMLKVLGSLEGEVTLSYSCRDLREDRELFPSSLILDVYRVITGDQMGDYSALRRYLGEPAGFMPIEGEIPLNDWEWWLAQKKSPYGSDSIFASYPHLAQGENSEMEREKEELSEYDGWVPAAGGLLDPVGTDMVLSCSRLEDLAKCPFAFFVRHVLGVEPLEEMEKDVSRWLDPLQRGGLLHAVFCRFMEALKERGERPALATHLSMLKDLAREEVERWREEVPLSSDLAFKREMREIGQTLEIFLRDEEEHCRKVEPLFFECSFGIGRDKGSDASLRDPVEIELTGGRRFRLRGRIDRIDLRGRQEYEVWDYKTGSGWGYKEEGYLNQGRHLQHALYAVAAETMLRRTEDKNAKVVLAGYFFPSPRGEGRRIDKAQVRRGELFMALEDLFELLRQGVFPASYDMEPCGICPYEIVCGGRKVAVIRCQKKIPLDKRMAPLERLKEYA